MLKLKFQRLYKIIFIISATLVISSCSTKLAYNYLDWALMWKIEKYIDLNADQKKQARIKFDEFHIWHKQTQLPKYALFLKELKVSLLNRPSAKQLHAHTDTIQEFMDDAGLYLLPLFAQIAHTSSEKQVNAFFKKIDKDNKKFKKENVSITDKKRIKKRQKDLSKHLKKLIGGLTPEQTKWIATWAESIIDFEGLMLKQQYIWREDYQKILNERADFEKTHKQIQKIMLYRSDDWIPELKQKVDVNQELTFTLMEKLFANLTHKQKMKLTDTIDKYIDICEDLSNQ